jgi:hypothetical protein
MNKHLIITAVTLVVVAIIVVSMWGTVDSTTRGSRDEVLGATTLPSNLPTVDQGAESAAGDSATDYRAAIDFWIANYDALRNKPDDKSVRKFERYLLSAAEKGKPTFGFADAYMPMEPGAAPEYHKAPDKIAQLIIRGVEKDEPGARVKKKLLALWSFGRRLYEHNLRMVPRQAGLGMMQYVAINAQARFGEADPMVSAMNQWIPHVDKITRQWDEKVKAIYTYNASVGDLVRIAEQDADKTFRVEALLQMGISQWTTNVRANVNAVHGCLEDFAASNDRDLARAARAAKDFTRENVRMLH